MTIHEYLDGNAYPGRGVLVGRSADNKHGVIAYFIMGRSENSRNRVFMEDVDGIFTKAFDESLMSDPSLIIYHPVRKLNGDTIVTNGDQTDTIRDFMAEGKSFVDALDTRKFEPDAPHFTSRISGLLKANGNYMISILKAADEGNSCRRQYFSYENPKAGYAHFIHTYQCDGNPLPAFSGEPKELFITAENKEAFAKEVWESLDENNRISLYIDFVEIETGKSETLIINGNK